MFINGFLQTTSDIQLIKNQVFGNPNCKAIFVGDTTGYEEFIRFYGMLVASPLVPDYMAMEADIEGSLEEFKIKYYTNLESSASVLYFSTILAALHMGKYIILFFPPEASGLRYPNELLSYLVSKYGLIAACPERGIQAGYDERYTEANASLLYSYNLMPPEEYLMYVSPNNIFFQKVASDMRIPIAKDANPNAVAKYILDFRNRELQAQKPLIKPFMIEVR